MSILRIAKEVVRRGYAFLKLETARDVAREITKKTRFKTPFDSEHAKGTPLLRSPWQLFYQNLSSFSGK